MHVILRRGLVLVKRTGSDAACDAVSRPALPRSDDYRNYRIKVEIPRLPAPVCVCLPRFAKALQLGKML